MSEDNSTHRVLIVTDAVEPELAVHAPVIGSVSVWHDPMDAIEDVLFNEPVDEIMLDVPPHRLSSWLHQDLEHRLAHLQIPVTTIRHGQ